MQVYLPDELYDAVKERGLSPSELLQDAVRAELRHQALLEETDRYLAELIDDVGEPTVVALAEPGGAVLTGDLKDLRALADHANNVNVYRA